MGIGIRDMGQPNIQVPLVKRTTSFSYFYGSEWKMVIYGDQMPKTSCFSFPKYCIVNLLSLSVLVPMWCFFFNFHAHNCHVFLHVIIVTIDFQNSVVTEILLEDFSICTIISQWSLKYRMQNRVTAKNILGIAHSKHYILLLVSRILEGHSGYFALLVASNQTYFWQEMILSNWAI